MSVEEKTATAEKARVLGVRTVAVFEAIKGALVLAVGFGLLSLINRDAEKVAEEIVSHLHLNPVWHYPQMFIEAASRVSDSNLKLFAFGAFLYALVRFIEAYGLWRVRAWAEWFAIISGGIYLPIEIYEIFHHPTKIKFFVFIINLFIVAYLIYFRVFVSKHPDTEKAAQEIAVHEKKL